MRTKPKAAHRNNPWNAGWGIPTRSNYLNFPWLRNRHVGAMSQPAPTPSIPSTLMKYSLCVRGAIPESPGWMDKDDDIISQASGHY